MHYHKIALFLLMHYVTLHTSIVQHRSCKRYTVQYCTGTHPQTETQRPTKLNKNENDNATQKNQLNTLHPP